MAVAKIHEIDYRIINQAQLKATTTGGFVQVGPDVVSTGILLYCTSAIELTFSNLLFK